MRDLEPLTGNASSGEQIAPYRRDDGHEPRDRGFDYESKLWGAHQVEAKPSYLAALRLEYALRDLDPISGKVLEIGCGGGSMTHAVKQYRPDLDLHGCDISEQAIKFAQSQIGDAEFRVGDTYNLPYGSNEFAAVLMFDVLEHLEMPGTSLAEIHRVLKPDGLFHLYVPCEGGFLSLASLLNQLGWKAKERYVGHIQRFTRSSLQVLIEDQGFQVGGVVWSGHIVGQLADVLYFSLLSLYGKNVPFSVEGYLHGADDQLTTKVVRLAKNVLGTVTYYESKYLTRVPGAGAHISCRKIGGQSSSD